LQKENRITSSVVSTNHHLKVIVMMMTDAELKFNYVNMCDNLNKSVVEINVTNYC